MPPAPSTCTRTPWSTASTGPRRCSVARCRTAGRNWSARSSSPRSSASRRSPVRIGRIGPTGQGGPGILYWAHTGLGPADRVSLNRLDAKLWREVTAVSELLIGRCLCGNIAYSCNAEPAMQALCHCTDCQRQTGSMATVLVGVPAGTFRVSGATLSAFETIGEDRGTRPSARSARTAGRRSAPSSPRCPSSCSSRPGRSTTHPGSSRSWRLGPVRTALAARRGRSSAHGARARGLR